MERERRRRRRSGELARETEGHLESERGWRRRRLPGESAREREGRLQSERKRQRRELAVARERCLECNLSHNFLLNIQLPAVQD